MSDHASHQSASTASGPGVRKYIAVAQIRLDGDTQPRCEISEVTVAEYSEAIQDNASFPPVVVFFDGAAHWLADGFHRYHGTTRAGYPTILAEVRTGTRRDAVLYGFSANTKHGLRETSADKRRKVEIMLRDDEWVLWSNSEIARRCGVSDKTVASVREQLAASSEIPMIGSRTVERAGTVYQQAARTVDINPAPAQDAPEIPENEVASPPPVEPEPVPPPSATVPAPAADGEVERLRAHNSELHDQLAELGRNLEEAVAEIQVLHRVTDADSQVKAALDEVRQVREHNRILAERVRGLTAEKAEAIKAAKRWKTKAERAGVAK